MPSSSTHQLDQATTDRLERIENVLSVLVRHNPGVGGYDAVREWLTCESVVAVWSCEPKLTRLANAFQRFATSAPSTPASPLVPHKLSHPHHPPGPLRIRTTNPSDGQPIPPEDIDKLERGGSGDDETTVGKGWLGGLEG